MVPQIQTAPVKAHRFDTYILPSNTFKSCAHCYGSLFQKVKSNTLNKNERITPGKRRSLQVEQKQCHAPWAGKEMT